MKGFIVAVALVLVGSARAEETTLKAEVKTAANTATTGAFTAQVCTNGTNKRRVELTGSSPCEVHYKKETEQPGHDQVLWTAKNDQKFCETKAQAFVEKLASMGWKCEKA
jgi:hypothetical protein